MGTAAAVWGSCPYWVSLLSSIEYLCPIEVSEFIAYAIRRWLGLANVETLYVEPGSPWENGYAESFHSRLRFELTNGEDFANFAEAKHLAEAKEIYHYLLPNQYSHTPLVQK